MLPAPPIVRHLHQPPRWLWVWLISGSLFIHIAPLCVTSVHIPSPILAPAKVRLSIKEPEAPPPLPMQQKLPAKPKRQQKPTPNAVVKSNLPEAPPIQGLTKESVSDKGTMAAPVGNTMMIEDTGKRLPPDQVGVLKGDLSAPASLLRDSVKSPPYTDQALDASLEGTWIVDVYLSISGTVTSAELRKKIGFGMDDRVINAAKAARFIPRKNRFGASEPGWAEIKFTLVIP
ncbi:MAG: energy transducer TonB [Proteobacteria bacterium]|nr:energy transducer TonB [Pseudomonadota bacterium]